MKRKMLYLLLGSALALMSAAFTPSFAQDIPGNYTITELKVQPENIQAVKISFKMIQPVSNLLVRIIDTGGRTVFLDNKYRFTGSYVNTVDFTKLPPGTYTIEIYADQKRHKSKIEIR